MNVKLKAIYLMLKPEWNIIADVGCDHALISWYSYKHHLNKKFINLDNKQKPLENGMNKHASLNNDAVFALSDGLVYLLKNHIGVDCAIIAGIGGINCLQILQNDCDLIKNYIVQVDNNQQLIDQWIIEQHYFLQEIKKVVFRQKDYFIYLITKTNESNK